jgi:phosphomannomutase
MAETSMIQSKQLTQLMLESGVGFGTSGARGLVSSMTDEVCAGYTHAFVKTMQRSYDFQRVAVAIDLRPSSPHIAQACASMLSQLGLQVIFCGAIPTPALALFAQTHRIPGIMVTGSHIPYDRNGLKFYRPDGEISKSDETAMLASEVQPLLQNSNALPPEDMSAKYDYIQRYKSLLGHNALTGLKLAIYQHSSVGRDLLSVLLQDLGAEVICLERSDTFVPIDTEAVSPEDVEKGLAWSRKYSVDAIISTDGDGDRPLISDEKGQWLRGDIVGLLTAKALKMTHLAVPVSCNTAIEASGLFHKVTRTRIGSPFVIAAMEEFKRSGTNSIAGFEANGGFLLGSANTEYENLASLPTRDAVLPIVCLLAEVKRQNKPLSELVANLPQRFTASDRLQSFPNERSHALLQTWTQAPAELLTTLEIDENVISADITDGLRLTLGSGNIIHLRPSGNAPELRCYVETPNQTTSITLVNDILNKLKLLVG